MATKKQKQELIDTLKFTPRTYRITMQGYGGECYAGRVDRKIYEYFREQKIDMDEYACSYDGFDDMPRSMQPFSPGAPFECDNLFHASGMELSELNEIEVWDENNKVVWSCRAGLNELEDAGVVVEEFDNVDLDELELGEVVFWGGQGEKGCFFDGEIHLTQPFDPSKLVIKYDTCDGWSIVNYVEYNDESIEGTDGYSTTGKWAEAKWVLGGDEEVYTDVVAVDDREDEGLTWGEVPESDCSSETEEWDPVTELEKIEVPIKEEIADSLKTDWYDSTVDPAHKGTYECEFEVATWPWPSVRMCEWTGKHWKESTGDKVKGNFKWRGVKEEFKDEV